MMTNINDDLICIANMVFRKFTDSQSVRKDDLKISTTANNDTVVD